MTYKGAVFCPFTFSFFQFHNQLSMFPHSNFLIDILHSLVLSFLMHNQYVAFAYHGIPLGNYGFRSPANQNDQLLRWKL